MDRRILRPTPGQSGEAQPPVATRIAAPTTSDSVAERIRAMIVTQGMLPGARLGREEDLARQFGVSRATLREGLRMLLAEHLVRPSRGRGGGIFVAATPQQAIGRSVSDAIAAAIDTGTVSLEQALQTRILLETSIAGQAALRASETDIDELRAIVAPPPVSSADPARLAVFDARLHRRIAEIADDGLTASLSASIAEVLATRLAALIRPLAAAAAIIQQHREIVEAIARRDAPGAEHATREHLSYLQDLVGAAQHYTPVSAGASAGRT